MKKILFITMFISIYSNAQESQMSIRSGIQNEELQLLLHFENISVDKLEFIGGAIKNKYYVLRIKEFVEGELVRTETLFDERGNDYFIVDTTLTSFRFLSKIDTDELKVWIRGTHFGSKQSFFKIDPKNGRYVVKDFLGSKRLIDIPTEKPFYIFAIITPNRNADGSGSYCKVAQSEISPEEFGNEFKIPHYFLIEMEFVKEEVRTNIAD